MKGTCGKGDIENGAGIDFCRRLAMLVRNVMLRRLWRTDG